MQQNSPKDPAPPPSSDLVGAPVIAGSPDKSGPDIWNLDALQERAMKLELHLADLNIQTGQLREQRDRASDAERPKLDKQLADAQHQITAASIELSSLHGRISQLQALQNRVMFGTTVEPSAPPVTHDLSSEQIMQIVGGGGMLLAPLVLVLARNLWIRGSRKARPADVESSQGLQRIEQAIEAIAVEVERIGEAQRFSTKLLSERQPDALANRAAAAPVPASRRESGSITPH